MITQHTMEPGAVLTARRLTTISAVPAHIPASEHLTHLQFRRFAGCPVCNLHTFSRRHDEITAAGITEVVVFHSPTERLREHAGELPFAVIADPDKRLYAEFGVEAAPRALLHPRALLAIARSAVDLIGNRRRLPPTTPHGGRLGLPADFLIDTDGRMLARNYGEHIDDQWSVDELLGLAHTKETQP